MRQLTITEACSSTNIWFKVESEEQQRMFQEEFFRRGGGWGCNGDTTVEYFEKAELFNLDSKGRLFYSERGALGTEQVSIIWPERV